MLDKIEGFLKDFNSAYQTARLYPQWHPQFKKACSHAYAGLRQALEAAPDLIIGVVKGEFAFEKEILFEMSKIAAILVSAIAERGIEKIEFSPAAEEEELGKFIGLLVTPKENIKHAAQDELVLLGVKNIVVGKVTVTNLPDGQEGRASEAFTYPEALQKAGQFIAAAREAKPLDQAALRLMLNTAMRSLCGRYRELLTLSLLNGYGPEENLHALNTALLAMYFAGRIGFESEEAVDLGIAALFHKFSARQMLGYVATLGRLPVVACWECRPAFRQRQLADSAMISLCCLYDRLSRHRGGVRPAEEVYRLMQFGRGKAFAERLLDNFFRVSGVYPAGCIVALSDGSIAEVKSENPDDIFSPKVRVLRPASKEVIDLKTRKDKLRITHSLFLLDKS